MEKSHSNSKTTLEDDIALVTEACDYADIQAPSIPEAFKRIVAELRRLQEIANDK